MATQRMHRQAAQRRAPIVPRTARNRMRERAGDLTRCSRHRAPLAPRAAGKNFIALQKSGCGPGCVARDRSIYGWHSDCNALNGAACAGPSGPQTCHGSEEQQMETALAGLASIGRLYDPLPRVAERIRDLLAAGPQTVWADDKGRVFVRPAGSAQPALLPEAIVGTYAADVSLAIIERDLRCALRERAREWLVDWDARATGVDAFSQHRALPAAPKSSRRGRKIRRARRSPSSA
jgi:hypothetical protein